MKRGGKVLLPRGTTWTEKRYRFILGGKKPRGKSTGRKDEVTALKRVRKKREGEEGGPKN